MGKMTENTKSHEEKGHKHSEKKSEHSGHEKVHKTGSKAKYTNEDLVKDRTMTAFVTVVIMLAVFALFFVVQQGFEISQKTVPTATLSGGNGDITIIEYSDFECPFCARALPTVEALKAEYGDRLTIEYRHFPLDFHPNAFKAAEASECARDQGQFWEYHDVLFANQQTLGVSALKQYAVNLGLDTATFNTCLDSGEKKSIVDSDIAKGRAYGVSGTPTFDVNGQKLVGAQPLSAFKAIIDQAAPPSAAAPSTPPPSAEPALVDGKVQIIEYSDFECPFCARAQPTIEQIKQTYGDNVELIYKHFPLSFHPNAQKAAEASECARDQGVFWEYHDVLFENQQALGVSSLKQYSVDLGLDTATFNSCLDSGEKASIVSADMAEGQAAGVTGTPGFLVGGELVVGAQPFSVFKEVIDRKLGGEAAVPAGPDTSNDPDVSLTVIVDPQCPTCDTTQALAVTTELFPTVTVTQIDLADAQELIDEMQIDAVPAYIFDSNIAQAASFADISQALVQVGNKYKIATGATGEQFKLLETPDVSGKPFKGGANAPVTIIEFSDFECPFCQRFYDGAYKEILDAYGEDIKLVYMHLPLSFHVNALPAAMASECAADQGKFWEYHDTLFENQQALTTSDLKGYAVDLGLDTATFDSCFDSQEHKQMVEAELELAQSVGISGTPGFLINGISVSGAQPFSVFQQIIDAQLAN